MDMTEIKRALEETFGQVRDAQTKTAEEIRTELKGLEERLQKHDINIIDLCQKYAGLSDVGRKSARAETIGEYFVKSDAFKAMIGGGNAGRARVTLEGEQLKAVAPIFETIDPNQYPVAPDIRPNIIAPGMNDVWIRDLLPGGTTTSNMVEYPREKGGDIIADYQTEGQLKKQSDLQFEMAQAPVVTIAHWLLASRQVLDDVPMLQSYINTRMTYGVRMKEDRELLTGDGATGHINGLIHQAAAFVAPNGDWNSVDVIRLGMAAVQAHYYNPTFAVLNPLDWATIQLMKNEQGSYLFGTPLAPVSPRLWNMNIASTYAMPQGQFLTGDARQAMVWDRQAVNVEVSREDVDNFRRNMVTILVEERLGLSVFSQLAFATGSLTVAAPGSETKAARSAKSSS
ncbi:phage major capsid protein [Paraburkholderia sp.]|jgi:HK97 family phage major capsid protein|uniref:phage major capsid protein n=1 Tax=Paraburkholderia sp. TaxID=1926495 RepID=UPI002F42C69F